MEAIENLGLENAAILNPTLYTDSSLRKKLIEHVFVGDLLRCFGQEAALTSRCCAERSTAEAMTLSWNAIKFSGMCSSSQAIGAHRPAE